MLVTVVGLAQERKPSFSRDATSSLNNSLQQGLLLKTLNLEAPCPHLSIACNQSSSKTAFLCALAPRTLVFDIYEINGTVGVSLTAAAYSDSLFVFIADPAGNVVAAGDGGAYSVASWTITTPGTYLIEVFSAFNTTYRLDVTCTGGGGGGAGVPDAQFTFSPQKPVIGQTIHFTDVSTGSPTSWLWDFGDQASSTAQNHSQLQCARPSPRVFPIQ